MFPLGEKSDTTIEVFYEIILMRIFDNYKENVFSGQPQRSLSSSPEPQVIGMDIETSNELLLYSISVILYIILKKKTLNLLIDPSGSPKARPVSFDRINHILICLTTHIHKQGQLFLLDQSILHQLK